MDKSQITPKVFSTKFKLIWGLASLGTNIISGVYAALLTYFFQTYLGLPASWIGLSALIYAIWNAVNDPLFGFLSDSTKSKQGRRIPYLRYTAPFLALTFILVWLVPRDFSDIGIFWWMLITMLMYDTAYTIIGLVYSALLPELTESDKERGELQKYSSAFALVGIILGFILPDLLRPKLGQTSLFPLYVGMIVIGISGAICVLAASFKVKERKEFTEIDEPLGLIESLKYTFTSKSFIVLVIANFMNILVQSILLGAMYYLADYVLKVPAIIPLAMIFLGLLTGTFLANKFAGKFGVSKAQQILLVTGGSMLCMLLFVPDIVIYPLLYFAGFGLSGPLVLTNVLFAQVADEDELKSGVRREAAFFGTNALITKPAQSIALALSSFMIEVAGFIPADGETGEIELNQPLAVLVAIKIIIGLIPGLAMLASAAILQAYPLKGEYLVTMQVNLLKLHSEKHKKLKEKMENLEKKL